MQTDVTSDVKGLNIHIFAMTQAQLGQIATAFFAAFPNNMLKVTHDDQGYHTWIEGYPVSGTLSALVTSLQNIQSVVGVGN